MKTLAGLIGLLLLCGCEETPIGKHMDIVNESGRDIVINSYQNTSAKNQKRHWIFSKKIAIPNLGKYGRDFRDWDQEARMKGENPHFAELVGGDSIAICYGDTTKGYSNSQYFVETRNPYFIVCNKKEHNFVYTITQDDYNNAMTLP